MDDFYRELDHVTKVNSQDSDVTTTDATGSREKAKELLLNLHQFSKTLMNCLLFLWGHILTIRT